MHSNSIVQFIVILILLIGIQCVYAEVIIVPDDFETIQGAIDAAEEGDTVLVQPGEYVENISFSGKRIVVASLFLTTGDPEFIAATIIDGNEESRVVSFTDLENRHSVLKGFTIRNGATSYGGGIYIRGASPALSNLIITQNSATHRAGGIYCTHGSSPAIVNVTVVGNSAGDNQGGIHAFHNSNPIAVNSIFWDNDPPEIHQAVEITFSDVEGGFDGEGNIDVDPLFEDIENSNFNLTEGSPCVDAGSDLGLPFRGEAPDMGAMEFVAIDRERHFQYTRTDNNHSLLITDATLAGEPISAGNEIGVFSPVGLCCGAGVWEGERFGLAARGDDPESDEVDGLRDGEEMAFRMWDWQTGREYRAVPGFQHGEGFYQVNGFSSLELEIIIEQHWQEPEATDNNHSLLVTGATLDGEPLAVGDEIGVFTEAELLAGMAIWSEEGRVGIAVWGDNIHTEDVVEGFVADEPFTFLVWDHIDESESPADAQFSRGPEVYTPNGFSVLELEAHRVQELPELAVQLNRGWNMISINVSPPERFYNEGEERGPAIPLMMAQLLGQGVLDILKNSGGQFYMPDHNFNNIPYWNLTEGYLINVSEDAIGTWSGEVIPADTDIPLHEGWNIIAYYPEYELPCEAPDFTVFSPILDHVIIAKDGNGNFAVPEFNYSDIPPWWETQGYQVRVDADVVLNYPEEQGEVASVEGWVDQHLRAHWTSPTPTCENMSVLVTSVLGIEVQPDDQIAAFNHECRIVGAGVFAGDGRCGLAVWGDDPLTEEVDGLQEGEAFTLRLWDADREMEAGISVQSVLQGSGLKYSTDTFTALDVSVEFDTPNEFFLSEAYPNPFNSATRITYELPFASRVLLEVFNLSGRKVATLVDNHHKSGVHTFHLSADNLPSGLYIIRLGASGQALSSKVLLIK